MAEEATKKKQSLRYTDAKKYYGEEFKEQKLEFSEGRTEVEDEILRLRAVYGLSSDEVDALNTASKDVPSFPMYSDKTVDKMSWGKRKDYKKDKKAYLASKKKWEEGGVKAQWDRAVQRAINGKTAREEMRTVALSQKLLTTVNSEMNMEEDRKEIDRLTRENQALYPTVEATPDAMDEALRHMDSPEVLQVESQLSQHERDLIRHRNFAGETALVYYMTRTDMCNQMNGYFRKDKGDRAKELRNPMGKTNGDALHTSMSALSLSRDLVTRRGAGKDAIAHMIGLTPDEKGRFDMEAVKRELTRRFNEEKPFICSDKGFVSTAAGEKVGYSANGNIEFVILSRKGTRAANVSNGGYESEREVLLDAGTQFKVVGLFFNDSNDPESQREITLGDKGAWKIYLETIPQTDTQGTLR